MAFVPTTWVDGPGGNTPVTAAQLNRIEQGILDSTNSVGRTVPANFWQSPDHITTSAATGFSAGNLVFMPVTIPNGSYDALGLQVTTASVGGTFTITLALWESIDGLPNTGIPAVLSGTVDVTATGIRQTTSTPTNIQAGYYWSSVHYTSTVSPTTAPQAHGCTAAIPLIPRRTAVAGTPLRALVRSTTSPNPGPMTGNYNESVTSAVYAAVHRTA